MQSSLTVKANDPRKGMAMDEISTVLAQARTQGFTEMGRTRVGFRGQIIEMKFFKPEEKSSA